MINWKRFVSVSGAAVLALASVRAQQSPQASFSERFDEWRAVHGADWRVIADEQTGYARFVYGGSSAPAFAPQSDSDFVALARTAVGESLALHGVEPAHLVEDRVVFLPLANAGSSDKVTVQLRQELRGVRVVGGYFNVLFDARGRLLSLDTTAVPGLGEPSTEALVPPAAAARVAARTFQADTGLPPTAVGEPELVFEQVARDSTRVARLAWRVRVDWTSAGAEDESFTYSVDARGADVLARRRNVHRFDVSGKVKSLVTPGTMPDGPGNPEAPDVVRYATVVSSQGNAVTDADGDFTIVGATTPTDVVVMYSGTYCEVVDAAGGDHSTAAVLQQASGEEVLMNALAAPTDTAEANAFNWINRLRDWTRATNPADATADFQALANVNLPAPCNALYNGISVNFFIDSVICANSAYSTVVVHEMGHWLNDRYNSGNGSDGFGEGNADVYAMYIVDDPIVGRDLQGPNAHIRNGNNVRQFCGNCCPGCYGEVHDDGEVLMGALWKVRANLKTSLGVSAGSVAADTLFNGWMNAYNDGQIKAIIEVRWLTLDDDDGTLQNGTPNYAAINAGFVAQGFPGFALSCSPAAEYCTSKLTSAGTSPSMGYQGTPSLTAGNLVVSVSNALPLKSGLFFYGSASASVPFFGGTRCVATPLVRTPITTTSASGSATLAVPIDAGMVGTTRYYQFWFRDPQHQDGTTVGLSNGLQIGFCAN